MATRRYGWKLRDAVLAVQRLVDDPDRQVSTRNLSREMGDDPPDPQRALRVIRQLREEGLAEPDKPVRLTEVGEALATAYRVLGN